jgi:hypothetical protein
MMLSKEFIDVTPALTAEDVTTDQQLSSVTEWNEPKPLQRDLSQSESFPIQELGNILAPAAQKICDIIQAPAAICGQSVLAAAALAVQVHADIDIDGRISPLSEFFVTVGESGERKSAVDQIALWAHRKHQEKLNERYDAGLARYKIDSDAYQKAREEALKKSKGLEAKREALGELGEPPTPPLEPVIIAEEPTYEGLVRLFISGQPGLGLFSDEGGRLIGGHGMNADNQLKTAAGLSLLWDKKPITRVRAGDGCCVLYGRRLSLHLMVQPRVANLLFSNSLLLEQGLLSRCLVSFPQSTAGLRLYKEIDLTHEQALKAYSWRLMSILDTDPSLKSGKLNELEPRKLQLTPEAKRLWVAFHNEIEQKIADGREFARVRGFANKAPEHAARLSGILAITDIPDTGIINADRLTAGIGLVRYYLGEALRLFDNGAVDPELSLAQRLLEWLMLRQKPIISLVEIYRYGPSQVRNAKTARKLMEVLWEHGWVKPCGQPVELEGIQRRDTWAIRLKN